MNGIQREHTQGVWRGRGRSIYWDEMFLWYFEDGQRCSMKQLKNYNGLGNLEAEFSLRDGKAHS